MHLLNVIDTDPTACIKIYVLGDVTTQVALQPALKFNGGGHINHTIFWTNLSPNGGGEPQGEAHLKTTTFNNLSCLIEIRHLFYTVGQRAMDVELKLLVSHKRAV